jgi:hypothetical protein
VTKMLFLASGLAALVLLAGCGASTPRPDPAKEARLVGEANALCRSFPGHSKREQEALRTRLAVIAKALDQTAAYLPAGRARNEARAKQRVLLAEIRKHGSRGFQSSGGPALLERSYQLRLQIYDDDKALGLVPCLGQPPRAPVSG